MGKKGRSKKRDEASDSKAPPSGQGDTGFDLSSDADQATATESDTATTSEQAGSKGSETPGTDGQSEQTGERTAEETETEQSDDNKNSRFRKSPDDETSSMPQTSDETEGQSTPSPEEEEDFKAPPITPEKQKLRGRKRKGDPGSSRAEFLKMLVESGDYQEQLLEAFATRSHILARVSSTSMKAVAGASDLAEEDSEGMVRDYHVKEDFKEIYKIQLPFPHINENIVLPKHKFGPELDKLVHRTHDSNYLEAFHLNYPRRDSVDVYAENLLWLRDLLGSITNMAATVNEIGALVDIRKFTRSPEHDFIDALVKKEFRSSLLQRVRRKECFDEGMYEDQVTFSSKESLYSPYFSTKFTELEDHRIVAAQLTLAATIVFLKLTDDALHNGRLLSCLAYGHLGLTLAAKFYSTAQDKGSFTTLELLHHQRLVTAIYRLTIYADLEGKVVDILDDINAAFKCVEVFNLLHMEGCPDSYVPEKELMNFIANLRAMKTHFYDDRQLVWERHFLVILRLARTVNMNLEHLQNFTELKNLKDRSSPALTNILSVLSQLDSWEDHLNFYTCHNLAPRLLLYKAQVVGFLAEFVTDYKSCYQYSLTKISQALELEKLRIPNMDVIFHRQCVNNFKVTQIDAALRMMWEIQSTSEVHETITLLQRTMESRTPSWVLRKNEDCAFSVLASVMLLDYLSGLTSYLSNTVVDCMRKTAIEQLKEMELTDSLRDAAISIVWDKLEKTLLVKEARTFDESLRLLKISFYILPVLMHNYWSKDSEYLMKVFNSSAAARTDTLAEVNESYTVTVDPNLRFGQKMLHDFTRNWYTTQPPAAHQTVWPKPWKLDNTNEFECGSGRRVFFMNTKPIRTEVLDFALDEYNEAKEPGVALRGLVAKKLNHKEFQTSLGTRTAQFVIRSNDFELEVMKEELRVVLRDDGRRKISNHEDFISLLMLLLEEIAACLEARRSQSKLQREQDQYSQWLGTVKNLIDDIGKRSSESKPVVKVLTILLDIALTFGFPIEQHIKCMPDE